MKVIFLRLIFSDVKFINMSVTKMSFHDYIKNSYQYTILQAFTQPGIEKFKYSQII